MRWLPKTKSGPKNFDRRVVRRFLFLPKTLPAPHIGQQTRWLELTKIEQYYHIGTWWDQQWHR